MDATRRALLAALAGGGVVGLAGCLDQSSGTALEDADGMAPGDGTVDEPPGVAEEGVPDPPDIDGAPPVTTERPGLAYELETLDREAMSGGVGQDGIPAIGEELRQKPVFTAASNAGLAPGDPVFGVVIDGIARAYPQNILVWHEIVTDTFGDEHVAITYCPLTGTAQGFERGETSFGVSGMLVNSNLIMFDRATESWWPQILATAINGPMRGLQLREFRVIWTTWERWTTAHPDTEVLTEDTGFFRDYARDPYGTYNPMGGYYTDDSTLFPPLIVDNRDARKAVVIGTRTVDGALAFNKDRLLDERVLEGHIGDTPYTAVSDPALASGYVYENPDGIDVEPDGDRYVVDGDSVAPDALPLARSLAFDAMWFAWAGFYPHTAYVD